MTVGELIDALRRLDGDATVLVGEETNDNCLPDILVKPLYMDESYYAVPRLAYESTGALNVLADEFQPVEDPSEEPTTSLICVLLCTTQKPKGEVQKEAVQAGAQAGVQAGEKP